MVILIELIIVDTSRFIFVCAYIKATHTNNSSFPFLTFRSRFVRPRSV